MQQADCAGTNRPVQSRTAIELRDGLLLRHCALAVMHCIRFLPIPHRPLMMSSVMYHIAVSADQSALHLTYAA